VERSKKELSVSEFEFIAKQVAPLTNEVVLHLLGEPLGHSGFGNILDSAERYKLPVNIVTNGVLLTGDRSKQLLKSIVRQVSFSLHSFEENFPHLNPETYIKRILSFIGEALQVRPDLYINLRLWDLSGYGASESTHNAGMRQILAKTFDFTWDEVTLNIKRKKNWRIKGRLYLHFDSRFEWPKMSGPVLQERGTCHALKGHIGIHADGLVVPCCLDHKGDIPLGNIFSQPLTEILNSPRALKMRQAFNAGELTEPLCKTCGFIQRFAK
jgi:radical SAM protein with 4Fe4S-binding SPASM domain